MANEALLLLIAAILVGLAARLRHRASDAHTDVRVHGSGTSLDDPVVVTGSGDELIGIEAEFAWLEEHFGRRNDDWRLLTHASGMYGDQKIDTVELDDRTGDRHEVFFDITESFGKRHPL